MKRVLLFSVAVAAMLILAAFPAPIGGAGKEVSNP